MNALGIDISKNKVDVYLLTPRKALGGQYKNDADGFAKLITWLKKQTDTQTIHVCMEATGKYHEALALALHEAKLTVSVVNPLKIKAFAEMKLQRTKTDKCDAKLIAQFCQEQKPAVWTPKAPEIRALEGFLSILCALQEEHTRWLNRFQVPSQSDAALELIKAQLDHLQKDIKALEERIRDHIQHYPNLKVEAELLDSIPGIGPNTIAWLLSINLSAFDDAKAAAAYAGICPSHHQSGTSVHGQSPLSKVGNAQLRKQLYMPSLSALRFNPILKAMADRMSKAGKKKMVIIGAAMRKLLILAFGVLKSRKPFDPDFVKSNLKTA